MVIKQHFIAKTREITGKGNGLSSNLELNAGNIQ